MTTYDTVREPAVAGAFYPESPDTLARMVDGFLGEARARDAGRTLSTTCPKAIVVPHAGYVYSGAIAASAFAELAPYASRIRRVVLVGPAHRVFVEGMVSPAASGMRTPLGDVRIDTAVLTRVPDVAPSAEAHAREHSLEVELPFLQRVLPHAVVVPIVVGHAEPDAVADVLRALWGGAETVLVVSSDLSHYLPYAEGRAVDVATAARIVAFDGPLSGEEACGAAGLNGLLLVAREKGMRAEILDLRSSGDTAGRDTRDRDGVVGYGAFAFYEESP